MARDKQTCVYTKVSLVKSGFQLSKVDNVIEKFLVIRNPGIIWFVTSTKEILKTKQQKYNNRAIYLFTDTDVNLNSIVTALEILCKCLGENTNMLQVKFWLEIKVSNLSTFLHFLCVRVINKIIEKITIQNIEATFKILKPKLKWYPQHTFFCCTPRHTIRTFSEEQHSKWFKNNYCLVKETKCNTLGCVHLTFGNTHVHKINCTVQWMLQ